MLFLRPQIDSASGACRVRRPSRKKKGGFRKKCNSHEWKLKFAFGTSISYKRGKKEKSDVQAPRKRVCARTSYIYSHYPLLKILEFSCLATINPRVSSPHRYRELIEFRTTHLPGFHKVREILHDTFRECHFQSRIVFRKMAKSFYPQRRPEDEWKLFTVHRAHLL